MSSIFFPRHSPRDICCLPAPLLCVWFFLHTIKKPLFAYELGRSKRPPVLSLACLLPAGTSSVRVFSILHREKSLCSLTNFHAQENQRHSPWAPYYLPAPLLYVWFSFTFVKKASVCSQSLTLKKTSGTLLVVTFTTVRPPSIELLC